MLVHGQNWRITETVLNKLMREHCFVDFALAALPKQNHDTWTWSILCSVSCKEWICNFTSCVSFKVCDSPSLTIFADGQFQTTGCKGKVRDYQKCLFRMLTVTKLLTCIVFFKRLKRSCQLTFSLYIMIYQIWYTELKRNCTLGCIYAV